MDIFEKIKKRCATVAVIGLGYVGLPLMMRISESGFNVVGIDLDKTKINMINQGQSYINDICGKDIENLVSSGWLSVQSDYANIENVDIFIICVPTPITINKDPDLTYILSTMKTLAQHLRKGQVIILESTSFPGTTEEFVLPILEQTGMRVGIDFFLGFSPERVDPGNSKYQIKNTPKIVSGVTKQCNDAIFAFYSQFIRYVYKTSSPMVAEMAKTLENTFRNINIALVNELVPLCNRMGIDIWEVIEVASTKPFGFMPFYPGPGLGGHCIPVDPLYLSWKAKEYSLSLSLIEISDNINSNMPYYVIERIQEILNGLGKPLSKSKILLLGASYKKDIADERESPIYKIMKGLKNKGSDIAYNDPYISELCLNNQTYYSQQLSEDLLKAFDCTVLLTPHSSYDFDWIVKYSAVVFDTRNALQGLEQLYRDKIVKL